ncbi:B12-binding domain-containing protein [Ahrensia sp. R2A130]|uniref:cobalamin B12-binding domain-containing protein n=1 Tax=Ahrensia sp. R2A130 TaxID=744979 RepID=UPI0001E08C73|nr:cobalamin-dependent protein [Ahrensia sp. R2A130]EFL89096.1 cobalamin B12-binding domain-containing protein [Ahrensia sp. R2A130]
MAGRESARNRQPSRSAVDMRPLERRPRNPRSGGGLPHDECEGMIDRAVHDFILPTLLLRQTAGRIALINEATRLNAENLVFTQELVDARASAANLVEITGAQILAEKSQANNFVTNSSSPSNLMAKREDLTDDEALARAHDAIYIEAHEIITCAVAALDGDGKLFAARWDALRQAGISAEGLYLGLLSPVAVELGRRWVDDESSFGEVTLAMTVLHQQLHASYGELEAEVTPHGHSNSIFLAPAPGTDHVFGAAMVELFFRAYGWSVTSGVGMSEAEIISQVAANEFDVVGLSLGSHDNNRNFADLVARLREVSANKSLVFMAGGAPFIEEPELAEKLGADATAPDATRAVLWARRLVSHKLVK